MRRSLILRVVTSGSFAFLLLATVALCAESAAPPLSKRTPSELAATARAAKTSFVPVGKQQVQDSKDALQQAVDELDRLLIASGDEKEQGWKKYLKWEDISQQIEAGEQANPKVLSGIVVLMSDPWIAGLERRQVRNVRDALQRHSDTVFLAANEKTKDIYEAQLDALATALEAYAAEPSDETANAIGLLVGWLERAGQAEELITAVRSRFWQPNLFVEASERLVVAGIGRAVDDTSPVEDVILGTSIYGTGHTLGRLSARLIPNEERAEIDIMLSAKTASDNVGYRGRVTIFSQGTTITEAHQQLLIDATGLHTPGAEAKCETATAISHVSIRPRFLRKFVRRQVEKKKPEAESIASLHAEDRIEKRMNDEANELIEKGNKAFEEKIRDPLLRTDAMPRTLKLSTNDKSIAVKVMQVSGSQLAAPGSPPQLDGEHDLTVHVHESMAVNAAEALIGGMKLTDERLVEMLEESKQPVPEELKITEDKDPWSITFAQRRPVVVAFGDGKVRLAIRGRQFTRADQTLNMSIEIAADYEFTKTESGSQLIRQGDVEVTFLKSTGRLSVRQIAFKTFLRKKFNALFKPEFVGKGIDLPEEWEKAGKLTPSQLNVSDGWLSLGWSLSGPVVVGQ